MINGRDNFVDKHRLRIYPIYLLVFALSILVTIGFNSVLEQPLGNGLTFDKVMPLPGSFGDWVANLTLLYLPSGNTFNVSPAWRPEVTTELLQPQPPVARWPQAHSI
jgi:peptidoglycan/LPS O-acetylase OafA/YrhL